MWCASSAIRSDTSDRNGPGWRPRETGERALARGALVGFLDHDDVWLPTKLERQLESLEDPTTTLALCAVEVVDERGTAQATKRLRARTDLLTGMLTFDGTETVSCSSAGLVRREELLRMGGFDPALSMSADWDLLFRMLLAGPVAYVDDALVRYRVHGENMSRDIATMEHDMTFAFAKAFADPRASRSASRAKGPCSTPGLYPDASRFVRGQRPTDRRQPDRSQSPYDTTRGSHVS